MEVEVSQPIRFIKRVPPSGGSPAYKLTLSHKVVKDRLQHLVGQPFQLASSVSSVQMWDASIASRRNKDRCEYILQGWKLFAEAHNLQPGDQVSFELASPRKLIVKRIMPGLSDRPSSSALDTSEVSDPLDIQPVKAIKTLANTSPSRKGMQWSDEDPALHARSRSLESSRAGHEPSPLQPLSSPASALPLKTVPMAQRVQSWMSLNLPSPQAASAISTASKFFNSPHTAAPAKDSAEELCPHNDGETLLSHLDTEMPGVFDDLCHGLDTIVPDVGHAAELSPQPRSAPQSLHSSLELTQPSSQPAYQVQSRENELRALVTRIQDRLDQSTRSALQATMGLENCVVEMTHPAIPGSSREVQAKMFKYLSSLKESLWQVLLVSNDAYANDH